MVVYAGPARRDSMLSAMSVFHVVNSVKSVCLNLNARSVLLALLLIMGNVKGVSLAVQLVIPTVSMNVMSADMATSGTQKIPVSVVLKTV
jgi:hypothetical protein